MAGRGLLVAGTASDAGKTLVVAGLCRILARRGLRVAPFKAQNMSNNSMVCLDGAEIGRAQYLQAIAARVVPEAAMNPVLLKPGTDRRAHVVVNGKPFGTLEAGEYATGRKQLAEAAFTAYRALTERFDLVVCEGAGSPAEINLRAGDYVNMGLAQEFGLPVVVVGDIDRGGVLAAFYGTWALLDDDDRSLLTAFVVNKFRGDEAVLQPGLDEITRRTGLPVLGVLPWLPDVWLDGEDAFVVGRWRPERGVAADAVAGSAAGGQLTVAVADLPRVSNATDVDALACEPGVDVVVTADASRCATADLLVLPGTRATIDDLMWLQDSGIAAVARQRAVAGMPVLGICGGYQMLARRIEDAVEGGGHQVVDGLGLLPIFVRFAETKVLARPSGTWRGLPVEGYEIHHGVAEPDGDSIAAEAFPGGCAVGAVFGTMWHGTLEVDDFRRAWLAEVAQQAGSSWRARPGAPSFAGRREAMIDRVADAIDAHLDVDAVLALASARSSGVAERAL